jgi:hypothetical protein
MTFARTGGFGHSQRDTARRIGVDERTIRRWLTGVPGFSEYVQECHETLTDEEPLDVLHELLRSNDERVRLSAAQTLVRLPSDGGKPDADDDSDLLTGWDS